MAILRFDCLPHNELVTRDDHFLFDYASQMLWRHLEMYLDLSFFDQRYLKRGDDKIQIHFQKSALYLPLHSAAIQGIQIDMRNGKAKCQYEILSNPYNYQGIPDCLNDYGEKQQVFDFVLSATKSLIQREQFTKPNLGQYITILDKNQQFDVYITTNGQQGRCSVDKISGHVFGVMHTLLNKKRPSTLPMIGK